MSAAKLREREQPILGESPSSLEDDVPKDYDGFVSDEFTEKDETELELEKLVFGEGAKFQAKLSADGQISPPTYSREAEAKDQGDRIVSEAEEGLETLGDADVCPLVKCELINC